MNILGTAFISIVALNACLAFYLKGNKVRVFPGESVLLPCNTSGFPKDELHWEAMGKHVAVLHEGRITAGQGYEDRVFLKDPTKSDDFSLVIQDVMFSDGGKYQCLLRGQEPVCSLSVDVLEPLDFPVIAAEGENVTLHCFGNVPSSNPWKDIYIHWLKDEREVLRITSGEIAVNVDSSRMSLPIREEMSRGIYSLKIRSIKAQDQGVYRCRYKSTDHEDLHNGSPEKHKLIVLEYTLSTSRSSYPQTSTSVPTWTSVASTERSSEVSTSADTVEAASSQMSSTVESIPNGSNTSATQTGTSLPTWTDVTSTAWSSPVSTHSYVERTETEVISTKSAQTSADTAEGVSSEMSSTAESIPSSSWTHVASTESFSPVSHVEGGETGVVSTTSGQTSAEDHRCVTPLEARTSSGQYGSLELLSDEKIPWILIGLISGVLLITAGVLTLLMLFTRN